MANSIESSPSPQTLPLLTRLSYGVGHVLNDLCASMWFTYLLIFYHQVLGMGNIMAGNLLLIGQVADAICTPLVGYESDRINGCCGYGKRKSWHLVGSICVAGSFAFIFMPVIGSDPLYYTADSNSYSDMIYYAPFIVIFQFGWATTQISHLSLIPSLASCEHGKVGLNSIRYAATVMCSITVYVLAWLLLSGSMPGGNPGSGSAIKPDDYVIFRTLALIVVALGVVFSVLFHVFTKEPNTQHLDEQEATMSIRRRMRVLCWLKTSQFYIVGLVYMCTRLIVNIPQVYLGMYLTETLNLHKTYIAIVPLVSFISGFIATFPIKLLNKVLGNFFRDNLGKKLLYSAGLLLVCGASVWYKFLMNTNQIDKYLVMAAAFIGGFGSSTVLVLSLSFTADLIDKNTESAAFVYGAMSFTDKLSNGLAVQVIQILHPCKQTACCPLCAPFYKAVMTWVPIGCCVLAFFAVFAIRKRQTVYDPILADNDRSSLVNGVTSHNYGSTRTRPSDIKTTANGNRILPINAEGTPSI